MNPNSGTQIRVLCLGRYLTSKNLSNSKPTRVVWVIGTIMPIVVIALFSVAQTDHADIRNGRQRGQKEAPSIEKRRERPTLALQERLGSATMWTRLATSALLKTEDTDNTATDLEDMAAQWMEIEDDVCVCVCTTVN